MRHPFPSPPEVIHWEKGNAEARRTFGLKTVDLAARRATLHSTNLSDRLDAVLGTEAVDHDDRLADLDHHVRRRGRAEQRATDEEAGHDEGGGATEGHGPDRRRGAIPGA